MSKVLDKIWPGAYAQYNEMLRILSANNDFGSDDAPIDFTEIAKLIDKYDPGADKIPLSFFILFSLFGAMGSFYDTKRNAIWVDYNWDNNDIGWGPIGADSDDGSFFTPYTTVNEANASATPGDIIIVLPARTKTAYGSIGGSTGGDADFSIKAGVDYIIYPGITIVGPINVYYSGGGAGPLLSSRIEIMDNVISYDTLTAAIEIFLMPDGNDIAIDFVNSKIDFSVGALDIFSAAAAHTNLCTLSFNNSMLVSASSSNIITCGAGANFACTLLGGTNMITADASAIEAQGGFFTFSSECAIINQSATLPTLRFADVALVNSAKIINRGAAYAASFTNGTVVMYSGSWFESVGAKAMLIDGSLAMEAIPCSKQSIEASGTYAGTITLGRGVGYSYAAGDPTALGISGLAGQIVYDTTAGPPATLHFLADPDPTGPTWIAL